MKALHITFRYGRKVYGGAEYYLRKLSEELSKKGVDIDICTTESDVLKPLSSYGVLWDNSLKDEIINNINVFRFSVKNPNKYLSFIFEKMLRAELDKAFYVLNYNINNFINIYNFRSILLNGWHSLEREGKYDCRWTMKEAITLLNDVEINNLSILLLNMKNPVCELIIKCETYYSSVNIPISEKYQRINLPLPNLSGKVLIILKVDKAKRYSNDQRELGIKVYEIKYQTDSHEILIDLKSDYRSTIEYKKTFIDYLVHCAQSRQDLYSNLFDYLRGPESPNMQKWLDKNICKYDLVMATMFPFNTIKSSMISKKYKKPLILLPLMHVDDAFYHWNHYYNYLKRADHVLAISAYSKKYFFDKMKINSSLIGAGVDKTIFIDSRNREDEFRNKYQLQNKNIILTVSRKQQTKRYDMIIEAMKKVRALERDAHLVMIGPDDDKIPIREDGISYLGKVSEEDLLGAYDSCDVFAMMSISESFGLVFCEAWSRNKPVIGNINCGPVSTLIEDGINGFLCENSEELAGKIELLINNKNLASNLGKAGFQTVINNYTWDKIANKTYLIYNMLI